MPPILCQKGDRMLETWASGLESEGIKLERIRKASEDEEGKKGGQEIEVANLR